MVWSGTGLEFFNMAFDFYEETWKAWCIEKNYNPDDLLGAIRIPDNI